MDATELYNISDNNLAARREAVGLDSKAIAALTHVAGWATANADSISAKFYEQQFNSAAPSAFFRDYAADNGLQTDTIRSGLERAHANYFREIFDECGSPSPFGRAYFNKRLHVGRVHNTINLPLKLFLAAYVPFFNQVDKSLQRRYFYRPVLQRRVRRALLAVFNYDMQAVCDAFFVELLESLGLDTRQVISDSSDKDVAEQLGSLKALMANLISELRSTSTQLTEGSTALSQGSASLAEQTQRQSAALQQTAATISMITDTAKLTSDNAHHANELTANGGVDKAGRKTTSTIETMSQLSDSSGKITKITGLIEEIAFQTNLLALNASVEAARAGEHGRGFNIVASEVGKLAHRTTEAAQEIKSLIETSANNVETGVHSVKAVADLVQLISTGSQEQSEAISEISGAIRDVDDATQVNAHQADQLSSLAESLSGNAARVEEIAKLFKTG